MLSRRRKIALVTVPLALVVAGALGVVAVWTSYHDAAVRWTAVAGVLGGATLLAAAIGLPIAVYQLFAVQQDLARLSLVPPNHYQQLRGLLEASMSAVVQRQARIGFGDPPDGRPLFHDAFCAHFPKLSEPFGEWNKIVDRVAAAREAFRVALARAADSAGVKTPVFDRAAILNQLEERTRPSLHLLLEEWPDDSVPVEGYPEGQVVVAGIVTTVPVDRPATAQTLNPDGIRELVGPLVELCSVARRLSEVSAVADAQDALNERLPVLSDEIKLYLVTDPIPVAANCPICKRNLGQ